MKQVIVRYKLKKERVKEHEALIRAVFDELAKAAPEGLRYGAFREPDGVSYVHVAVISARENPLGAIAAFKAFTARIDERCAEPPRAVELTRVGAHAL